MHIPLCSDLNEHLPLPDLTGVRILWPKRYSWETGFRRLDLVKNALLALAPVELHDVSEKDAVWHRMHGFPVPSDKHHLVGAPHYPKSMNDIRGEVFEIRRGNHAVRCAYDYSDYPIVSSEIAKQVDVYFKCIVPVGCASPKVISVGYFPRNPRLLAIARSRTLRGTASKDINVYARFGAWTDSQTFRAGLISRLQQSSIGFYGGFGTLAYPAYLQELMRAKVALDAPGQAPISYRMPEAMALGAVVVCVKPTCVFPETLQDGVHYMTMNDDGSDVVEVCMELLKDEEHRRRIATAASGFFDRNFSPQSIARRILRHALAIGNG